MATRSNVRAMPSPKGTNREGLFVRTLTMTRDQIMALDSANGGNIDPLKAMRVDIENILGELSLSETQVAKILETLDEHAPFDKLDDDDPNAEHAALAGDDDEPSWDKFCAILRSADLSEADIDEAVARARNGGKAKDKKVKDGLPINALAALEPDAAEIPRAAGAVPRAAGAAALGRNATTEEELDRKFDTGRIEGEPARQAADHRMPDCSNAALARFDRMFPEASRIRPA
jgi:hypothetical protein